MHFGCVIFDEIQELRHSGTEKYSAASLLSDTSENVVGLSGTPIYNNGGEIWNVVNIIDFHFLGDWESFSREWCYGYGNMVVAKPELLGEHLRREGLMLRRVKSEVLKELPPKRRLVQEIDWDDRVYRELMQSRGRAAASARRRGNRLRARADRGADFPDRSGRPPASPRRRMSPRSCVRFWKMAKRCCSWRIITP